MSEVQTETAVSGIRPTGVLHLGNKKGAIDQFSQMSDDCKEVFIFAADCHATTEVEKTTGLKRQSIDVVKMYLACGIEPSRKVHIYRQSDVQATFLISTLLANTFKFGRLTNATTFKDRLARLQARCEEVSAALVFYPVNMAADILSIGAHVVPVGADQVQHVEMAREAARTFNSRFRETLVVPRVNLSEPLRVPGTDGSSKMGKSDNNTISLLDEKKTIQGKVARIPTQSETGGEMTDGTESLFRLVELFCSSHEHGDFKRRFEIGEPLLFAEMKAKLAESIENEIAPVRAKYATIPDEFVLEVLESGAQKAREKAQHTLEQMKAAMGL